MKGKNDFSKGNVISNIMSMAIPMILAQLVNVLYSIVDRLYIAKMPGDSFSALTGIGVALPVISIVMAFANLFGMGGAPLCSIERGRGNYEEAEKIMGNSFIMIIYTGITLTILGLIFKKPMLYLFGASDITYNYANQYITIYLIGNVFVMISLGMNHFINSQGFGRVAMMPISGLTRGSQPVMGFNYGAGEYKRVKKSIKFITLCSFTINTLMWLVIQFFPEFFIGIFNDDPEIIKAGIPMIRIFYLGFFIMSLQHAGQATFVALGKSKFAIFFSIFRKVVLVVPLAILLPRISSLRHIGVFLSEPISEFIGGAACYTTMILTVWKELKEDKVIS